MPRRIERPHPWRTALVILAVMVLLGIITGFIIRFAFTPYRYIDALPEESSAPR